MRSVSGKNVLITGGAKGMGRLFAERAIAEAASTVVLWDADESALNGTLTELADGPVEVSGYIVDVSDADAVADTAAEILGDLGRVDVVVNNAGIVRGNHYFWETDLERDARTTIEVNTLAPMYVAHAFLPAMIDAPDECRLVNLA
jgi:all-trans-retinol dehydrogenase (NAD+)